MRKLLIVLAIQFCLPACSALLARQWRMGSYWTLDVYTVLINAAFGGFALGLLPKRWPVLVAMSALLVVYVAAWWPALLSTNTQDSSGADNVLYVVETALGSLLVGLFCSLVSTLICKVPPTSGEATALWRQFRLRDLLLATGLVAFAALTIPAFYRQHQRLVPEAHLRLSGGDFLMAWSALPVFYQALRGVSPWGRLLLWTGGMYAALNLYRPHIAKYLPTGELQSQILCLVLFTLGSALLYRWAGLRIIDFKTRRFWIAPRVSKQKEPPDSPSSQ